MSTTDISSSSSSLQKDANFPIKYDRDGIPLDDPRLKGISRYLNNFTVRGRANVAKATVLAFAGAYLYFNLKDSKVKKPGQTAEIAAPSDSNSPSMSPVKTKKL